MIHKKNITGIILAGGKSSRMGRDKGFITLHDKSFVEHIITALKPIVSDLIIVSDHSDYDVFKLKRIEDHIKDAGPLSGIYSGLAESKTAYNIILSCDVPLITTAILKQLITNTDVASEVVMFKNNKHYTPLVALYKSSSKKTIKTALDMGERRLLDVLNQLPTKTIIIEERYRAALKNINTKTQLKELNYVNNH